MIDPLINPVKGKLVVPAQYIRGHLCRLAQHVSIEIFHLLERHRVTLRIKIVEVAENVAKSIANLAIIFRNPTHQLFGADYVFAEVH